MSTGILGIPLQSYLRDKENPWMWRSSWRKKVISLGPPQLITTDGSQMDDVLQMGRGNSRSQES